MSEDSDKSWPPIPSSDLKLSQRGPGEPAPGHEPTPPAPAGGSTPAPAGAAVYRQSSTPPSSYAWLVRGVLGSLLLGSLGVLYWTFSLLTPVQTQARTLSERVSKLNQDIAVMENEYPPQALEKLAEEFEFAGQLLFGGEAALTSWFDGLKRQLVPLALDATAEFGQPTSPGATNLAVAMVPATLTLRLQPATEVATVRTPYARILALLDELTRQSRRVDLVDLEVAAGANSIEHVKAVIELWATEEVRP